MHPKFDNHQDRARYLNSVNDYAHQQGVSLRQAWQQVDGGSVYRSYDTFRTIRSRHHRQTKSENSKNFQKNVGNIFRLSDLY
jgi:hypothetical protein